MTAVRPRRPPTIGAIGLLSWDDILEVERYPPLGGNALVTAALGSPGGTTLNAAAAARRLGAEVALVGLVGGDDAGREIRRHVSALGIDPADIGVDPSRTTDASTVIVDRGSGERAILWRQGARVAKGDRVPIDRLFASDVVIVDPDDLPLRRFLTDLPAHTRPGARLVGPLTFLSDAAAPDAVEVALRHDVVVGNEREYRELTGRRDPDEALSDLQARLRGVNTRLLVMTRGPAGATAATVDGTSSGPGYAVACRDATGAGDAFLGGLAFGLACRWPLPDTLRLASAVGALATTALGAQAGHPTLAEACGLAGIELDGSGGG